jgi:hypothetical protein
MEANTHYDSRKHSWNKNLLETTYVYECILTKIYFKKEITHVHYYCEKLI